MNGAEPQGVSRRQALAGMALAPVALRALLAGKGLDGAAAAAGGSGGGLHHAPRAKRIVWLFMAGALHNILQRLQLY